MMYGCMINQQEDKRQKLLRHFFIFKVCLPLEWKDVLLLQVSLESEIALTPETWYKYSSDEGLENFKFDFEKKINSKLCSMDINSILKPTEWQELFDRS